MSHPLHKKKSNFLIPIIALLAILLIIILFISTDLFSWIKNMNSGSSFNEEKGISKECITLGVDQDYFSQGSVQIKYENSAPDLFGDYCRDSKNLVEYSCYQNSLKSETYNCDIGCYEGACISPQDYAPVFDENVSSSCKVYSTISPSNALSKNQFGSYTPLNSIDNDLLTRWYAPLAVNSSEWIYFDLRKKKCISSIDLYSLSEDLPISYEIQASNDAVIWKTLKSNLTLNNPSTTDVLLPSNVVARYVRIVQYSSNRSFATLSDIRLYVSDIESS